MSTKIYKKQFAGQLQSIFGKKASFLRSYGGELQVEDSHTSDKFLNLKVEDTEVVINDYNTDANVGMGTGTANSSRFGNINEIVSIDEQVEFDNPKSFNDGIDRVTVNDNFEEVAASRFARNANAWSSYYDSILGDTLSDNASVTIEGELTSEGVNKAFDEAYETFTNNEVSDTVGRAAYITPEVFTTIVNSEPAGLEKGSSVNIDNNTLYRYKGFDLVVVPKSKMKNDIYFVADNVGVAGLGLTTARVIPHPDFEGIVVQGAAKLGKYIPENNKKGIIVADLATP